MVSALDSRSSGPGLNPGLEHCVVLLYKALNSHSASLHVGFFFNLTFFFFISIQL